MRGHCSRATGKTRNTHCPVGAAHEETNSTKRGLGAVRSFSCYGCFCLVRKESPRLYPLSIVFPFLNSFLSRVGLS